MGENGIEKWVNVKKIHINKYYPLKDNYIGKKMSSKAFDIAILELEEDIDLAKYTPACLATLYDGTSFDGKDVTVVGWGRLKASLNPRPPFRPYTTNIPMEANLTIVENCQWHSSPGDLCAGTFNPGKGTCKVSFI